MKKAVILILVCILLLCLTACSSPLFESGETMLAHINGLWLVDDTYTPTYYYFKDGQVYRIYEQSFEYDVESYFDSMIENGELEALCRQDFDAVINAITPESIIGKPLSNVQIVYEKNTIILDQGTSSELRFIITKQSTQNSGDGDKTAASEELIVVVQTPNSAIATPITKISDDPDFSGEYFAKIFRDTKEDYMIPIKSLAYDADTYGNALKAIHPEIKNWILTDKSDRTIVYTKNGSANSGGTYMITDSTLMLSKGGTSTENGAPFVLMYDLNGVFGQNYHLFIRDKLGSSVKTLLDNAAPLLEGLPGALSTKEILSLYEQQHRVSSGARLFETTVNSFTYKINQATTGNSTVIYITFPETVSLSSITSYANTMPEESESSATQPTESQDDPIEETVPVQTAPMSEVPYTTALSGSDGIYKSHDFSSDFVQHIGQDGVYTITEETYDDEGNLWGKLKSGLGWVLLEEAYTPSGRICSRCGLSEPDTIFTEDWKPGDLCFGCSRDDFHGDKVYCSECGADCTYRGLEDDGRCEDCHLKD